MISKAALCFVIAFGVAYLVLCCVKPKMVKHKDSAGNEKLSQTKAIGYSLLLALLACLVLSLTNGKSMGMSDYGYGQSVDLL